MNIIMSIQSISRNFEKKFSGELKRGEDLCLIEQASNDVFTSLAESPTEKRKLSKITLTTLSNDIILKILQYGDLDMLYNVKATCKKLNEVAWIRFANLIGLKQINNTYLESYQEMKELLETTKQIIEQIKDVKDLNIYSEALLHLYRFYIKINKTNVAKELVNQIVDKAEINEQVLFKFIIYHLQNNEIDEAEKLIEEISLLDETIYRNSLVGLIKCCLKNRQINKAKDIVEKIKNNRSLSSLYERVLKDFVIYYYKNNEIDAAKGIIEEIKNYSLYLYYHSLFEFLIIYHLQNKEIDEAEKLIEEVSLLGETIYRDSLLELIKYYLKNKKINKAKGIIEEFRNNPDFYSKFLLVLIKYYIDNNKIFEAKNGIEIIKNHCTLNVYKKILLKLFRHSLKNEFIDIATEIIRKIKEIEVQESNLTFYAQAVSELVEYYLKNNKISQAQDAIVFEKVAIARDFGHINFNYIKRLELKLFECYLENKKINEAKKLIDKMKENPNYLLYYQLALLKLVEYHLNNDEISEAKEAIETMRNFDLDCYREARARFLIYCFKSKKINEIKEFID